MARMREPASIISVLRVLRLGSRFPVEEGENWSGGERQLGGLGDFRELSRG